MYGKLCLVLLATVIFLPILLDESYAEPSTIKRYRDYQIEDFKNGTFKQTLGMPEYVWNGSQFVDRIIQNNSTHFNVYSEMGSFSFNKSSCTMTQYVKGFDPTTQTAHGSDIVIKDWFWTIARKNGGPWNVIDASIFNCNISTSSNSTGKYLTATRTHSSGSTLTITSAAPNGKPVEDFGSFYMKVTAWNGHQFAPVLWAKGVNTDTLTFRNGTTISIPQGVTYIDRSQLTVNSLDFIKNGNAFYLDWQKMAPQFKTLVLNKTGNNLDVQFGFNNIPQVMNTGSKMEWDPTFGYTVGTHKSPFSAVGNCNTNSGGDVGGNVGTDGAVNFCYYDSVEWNTGTIPDSATITDTRIRHDNTVIGGTPSCNSVKLTSQPSTITNAALQAEIIAGSVYSAVTCNPAQTDTITDLGTTADSDVQSRLSANWFAIGLIRNPNALAAIQLADFNDVELQVTYTAPPLGVTTLVATVTSTTSVDLDWSAPDLRGGTLQGYRINYTTPFGNPLTILQNNSGTGVSYSVTGLTTNTNYTFRVSAITQYGYNASGTKANVTTGFVPANFTIGSLNFNAQNPNIFPIRFERTDVNTTYTTLKVIYDEDFRMNCAFTYQNAQQTDTYNNITESVYNADENYTNFNFHDPDNDSILVRCWDNSSNETGRYVMTQTNFPLLEQIQNFRNGTYGTMGMFGTIDFITMAIILFSTVGFSRINEAMAGIINVGLLGALWFFEIIETPTLFLTVIAIVIMLLVITTRKD